MPNAAHERFSLAGQTALITGGGSGLGKAIAAAFIQHGANVVIAGRTLDKLEAAAAELDAIGNTSGDDPVCAPVVLDVTADESVEHAVRKTLDLFGGLHILVNSAGHGLKTPSFDLAPDDLQHMFNVHVTGSHRTAQAAGHVFREQHQGCIINLASLTSYAAFADVTAYTAAKHAVVGLTQSLANDWARYGIRTNAIAPGVILTELNQKFVQGTDRGRRILERTPMARYGQPEEVAAAAVFLASPAASFINGATLPVDGGFLACGIGNSTAEWA